MTGVDKSEVGFVNKVTEISVIKGRGVGTCARPCILRGGSRSSQMFDISCVLAFAILFMYAESPPPPRYIFTTLLRILLRMCILYIYKTAELTRERGGQRENRINPSNERERERGSISPEISKIGRIKRRKERGYRERRGGKKKKTKNFRDNGYWKKFCGQPLQADTKHRTAGAQFVLTH